MKTPSITIAIAAYNAEKNIVRLINSLLVQHQTTWKLDGILVHSDCSTDKTVSLVNKIKSKKVKVLDNKNRRGFAGSVQTLIAASKSDITLLLNDDIEIKDQEFVTKLITGFSLSKNIGLVTARPIPLSPTTFIEKSVIVGINTYENALYSSGRYHNLFTCDGKVLAMSKAFTSKLKFPRSQDAMGNVDTYLYLSCKKAGFGYVHAKNAQVYFRCPSTLKDWIRWTSRNNADIFILRPTFGDLVDTEFKFPSHIHLVTSLIKQTVLHPVEVATAFVVGRISYAKAKKYSVWLTAKWDVVTTSKLLH